MIPPILHAADMDLRPLNPDALSEVYLSWLNDPVVNRFLEVRFARQTSESIADFVRGLNASLANYLFGIFLGDRHIGNIRLGPIEAPHGRAEIGLMIGDSAEWGKGYARRAIAMVTAFAFDELKLHKVTAGCYGANEGSRRAFIAAGWHEVARYREHVRDGDRWDDLVRLERINSQV